MANSTIAGVFHTVTLANSQGLSSPALAAVICDEDSINYSQIASCCEIEEFLSRSSPLLRCALGRSMRHVGHGSRLMIVTIFSWKKDVNKSQIIMGLCMLGRELVAILKSIQCLNISGSFRFIDVYRRHSL